MKKIFARELDVSENDFGDLGIHYIATTLHYCSALTSFGARGLALSF